MDGHGHSELDPVLDEITSAKGLPNEFYIDDAMFDAEKKKVWFAGWMGVGFGKDIPEPGDAKPLNFLGIPLLLVRDKNEQVHVFQNICRHRGMILLDEPGKLRGGLIRCRYHSWCYALDGALKQTPHVGGPGNNDHEGIKKDELGLVRFRTHVWRDIIFVNVDGKAPPFEEVHKDLLTRWEEFEQPIHPGGPESRFTLEVKCNWKLAVENYCEAYHLPWVHPGLNSYSRLEDHYNIEVPDQYSGQGSLVYRQLTDEEGRRFRDFADLGDQWNTGAEYIALYPNLLLGVHRDHSFAIILQPEGPERTLEHVEIYYASTPDSTLDLDGLRLANAQLWKTVFEEDIFVVEGMQRGRHGPLFDGGKFAPAMDGPTHNFHRWVASRMRTD